MKAYKGFERDMTCRGFQYAEGETYHTDTAELCESGFHACKYPLDVLAYYPPNSSVYHEVELDKVSDECEDDSKVCAKTIRIGARMDIASLVKASVEYTMSKCNKSRCKHVTVDQGVASAEDDQSVAYVTGDYSAASAAGKRGVASATGKKGAAFAAGNYSAAFATGYWGTASADNPTAIAVAWGLKGRAKGVLGAYIVCTEWKEGKLICAKMAQVDGVTIKADTYYVLVDGNFVEMDE